MKIQRSLSTRAILFTSVSAMVGSGWLFGPLYAAKIAGTGALFAWVLAAILLLLIGITFAEIATALPLTGGIARYTQFTHGSTVSVCITWLAWLSCVAVPATEAQAMLQYSANYFPSLVHQVNDTPVLTISGFLAASFILIIFSFINVMAVRWIASLNNHVTYWKLAIPLLTSVIMIGSQFHIHNFHDITQNLHPQSWHAILWSLPTAGIVFSFLGFRECISMAGEAKNPNRSIPIALLSSIGICLILYLLVQVAFIGAISPDALVNGWHALSYSGDAGPFAGIALALGLHWLAILIYVDAVVSPAGTGLVYTMTTARLNYGMSANQTVPFFMMRLNTQGAPHIAVLFNFVIGLFMLIPLSTWQKLVAFQSTAIVLSYGMGPICLLALRKQSPTLKRPFRLNYANLLCPLSFYVCNLIAYWTGWQTIRQLGISLLLGIVLIGAYKIFTKRGQQVAMQLKHAWWLIPYLGGITVISYLGNFGGGLGTLTFGIDFAVLAVFSLAIFYLALSQQIEPEQTQAAISQDQEMEDFYQRAGTTRMISSD